MYIVAGIAVVFVVVATVVVLTMGKGNQSTRKKPTVSVQREREFIQRLSYLLKIVMEHSSDEKRKSSIKEVVRIGKAVHQSGGFRYMIKIHEGVTRATSPKAGMKLSNLWKGVGDWRGV